MYLINLGALLLDVTFSWDGTSVKKVLTFWHHWVPTPPWLGPHYIISSLIVAPTTWFSGSNLIWYRRLPILAPISASFDIICPPVLLLQTEHSRQSNLLICSVQLATAQTEWMDMVYPFPIQRPFVFLFNLKWILSQQVLNHSTIIWRLNCTIRFLWTSQDVNKATGSRVCFSLVTINHTFAQDKCVDLSPWNLWTKNFQTEKVTNFYG